MHDTRAENLRAGWAIAHGSAGISSPTKAAARAKSWASSPAVRAVMRGNRSRDTKPERRLRSKLHATGLRYRVNYKVLPTLRRTADVAFTKARVAVFVDGCFWHGCPEHYRPATKNQDFWMQKVIGNRQRDSETDALLTLAGWKVVRVWEHEDVTQAAARVADLLRQATTSAAG
ncbi:very short patch repair endonuclease [Micromonospora sp. NBC_01740]|nr:very short patch repair endonuclease [Micromonospora sp. NBC_01740]